LLFRRGGRFSRKNFETRTPRLPFSGKEPILQLLSAIQPRSSTPYRTPLLGGEPGTAQTIQLMRQLVDDAQADANFVRTAIDIVRNVPAFDEMGEMRALFSWVKRNIRFTKDPVAKEKLYPPQELLNIQAGDCDDIAMLLGAFGLALGYPMRLVTVAANPDAPNEFSHVYVEGEVPPGSGQWVAMDAARAGASFGEEPPVYFRKRAWSLIDSGYQDLRGLGSYGWVRGMGDVTDFLDTGILQQTIAETPAIIAAATGRGSATNPYGSFTTPYTPGYNIPPAGYSNSLPGVSAAGFSAMLPWILIGIVGIAVFKR
jgi:hypothetical protein